MSASQKVYSCDQCDKSFSSNSFLNRHIKTHSAPSIPCHYCNKKFNLNQHLKNHLKQHFYPEIRKFKNKVALLKPTDQALVVKSTYQKRQKDNKDLFDKSWNNAETAERQARKFGGDELWRACLVLTWSQYAGQTFKWLLENDVGWVAWLLAQFTVKGEPIPIMRWQKEQLLAWTKEFPLVWDQVEIKINAVKVR